MAARICASRIEAPGSFPCFRADSQLCGGISFVWSAQKVNRAKGMVAASNERISPASGSRRGSALTPQHGPCCWMILGQAAAYCRSSALRTRVKAQTRWSLRVVIRRKGRQRLPKIRKFASSPGRLFGTITIDIRRDIRKQLTATRTPSSGEVRNCQALRPRR
jgi:hypothetical protein